jgi:lipocalin
MYAYVYVGEELDIEGFAFQADPTKPGELKLKFENMPFVGNYWILALGPIIDNKYQYSIVSDDKSSLLFVLARDVHDFKEKYDAEVRQKLFKMHFRGMFKGPIPRYHDDDCVYG